MPTPADGMARRVQVEALTKADVASAVELAVRVLQVKPGDRGEQFTSDITDDRRQMFLARLAATSVAFCFRSERSAAGVDVLSKLARTAERS